MKQLSFTEDQKNVFEFVERGKGHCVISAVAGAGKTTTLIESALYTPVAAKVLYCAFNKSVQTEIEKKFREKGFPRIKVHTIHSLGYGILNDNLPTGQSYRRTEDKYLNIINDCSDELNEYLTVVLDYAKLLSIKELEGYEHQGVYTQQIKSRVDKTRLFVNSFQNIILKCVQIARRTYTKNTESDFRKMVSHFSILGQEDGIKNIDKVIEIFREITFKLLDKGENLALNNRIIDYTDMIYLPVKWNLNAHVSFDFVFVDECQDLSLSQIYIISKCMHQSGRVIAVGDPFQSIYGFAGADTQSFDNLKKLLKAENFVLKGSFRCAQNVIKEAKKVRPEITGHRKEEGEVKSIDYDDILSFIQANDLVVSRQRETIISLALQLMEAGKKIQIHERLVPAITSSLRRYFKQKELEINLLTYNDLDEFFRQVRERAYNEIDREARRILNEDEKKIIVGRKKSMAKELLGYMKRHWKDYPNVRTISSYCAYFESSLLSINATDAIRLYTIHFAKGLEEDRVFVLDYDTLPVIKNSMRAWEKKQEINLKYVAITRPKDVLFLVKSKNFEAKEQPRLLFEEI